MLASKSVTARLMPLALLVLALAAMLSASGCRRAVAPAPLVAVGNSYLESAVRDLLGKDACIARLAEPGLCPGHVDVRPSQVEELRSCRLLLLFQFQGAMDRQASGLPRLQIVSIAVGNGMCEPESYFSVCQQTADALVKVGLLRPDLAKIHLMDIDERLKNEATILRRQIENAGITGTPVVVASEHQIDYCRWLGLDVVASIGGQDSASVHSISDAVAKALARSCKLVVANRPDGTQLADLIADHLGGPVAVFDNFPSMTGAQTGFEGMLVDNVGRLIAAASAAHVVKQRTGQGHASTQATMGALP